jgi:hypothetical protein
MRNIKLLLTLLSMLFIISACTSEKTDKKEIELLDGIPDFVHKKDLQEIDWKRKPVKFNKNMIGNENKAGIIGADKLNLRIQKWMWHLWDVEAPETKKLTVVGYHKETKTFHQILVDEWSKTLAGPNNGADAHIPSNVKIPESGDWAILLYIDEKLFDILVFEVDE